MYFCLFIYSFDPPDQFDRFLNRFHLIESKPTEKGWRYFCFYFVSGCFVEWKWFFDNL